ncbi:probable ATP-dependent helicase PF08_0048 [Hydra vulgaris]|uniref:Probable ATP-dependent helicase PF08_0048 n=1 Tax=Hydra vulgaris TaxID=6087 RepID=A0ABM4B992_HYDVU
MEVVTDIGAATAQTIVNAQAACKTYAQVTTNNNYINDHKSLKNTLLCKVQTKVSDNDFLLAIEEAGYDKYLFGYQQIRNGSVIEIVMKNDLIKHTILEKGININGVKHPFYPSTPNRNINKRVTISILGLPIEESNFPAGKYLEELGYGRHLRTKPLLRSTPKNKTPYYSGIIVVIMDNLQKPIPRFINLNGYEVRAIYNGQEDVGRPQKKYTTNQQKDPNDYNKPSNNNRLDTTYVEIENPNHIIINESTVIENEVNKYKEKVQTQTLETATESQLKTNLERRTTNDLDTSKTNEVKKVADKINEQDSEEEDSLKDDNEDDDNSNDGDDSEDRNDYKDKDDSKDDDGKNDDDDSKDGNESKDNDDSKDNDENSDGDGSKDDDDRKDGNPSKDKDNSKDDIDSKYKDDSKDDNNSKVNADSQDDHDCNDNNSNNESSEDECEVPDEFLKLYHLDKVDYNWKHFKKFDRLNCSEEELKKFKVYKKYEWVQYERAVGMYKSFEKRTDQLIPIAFQQMDSGDMYSYNMKEFKNVNRNTEDETLRNRYIACRKAEWDQRRKEYSQFQPDHEKKQEERAIKKQIYQSKKAKLTPQAES